MIKFLRIRNLATIEDLRMDLEPGFTILTGETGAGKSIIIDSIRLVCGEKAAADVVRTGRAEAAVEAIFDRPASPPPDLLPEEAGDDLTLQRTIGGDGTGKAYGDGVLVPVKRLKELAGPLVDIYGQNDHVFLLRLESHLEYLDHFGGTVALRDAAAETARELRRLSRMKADWEDKRRERGQRLDYLEFQIREIDKAALRPGEEEELRARRHILKNAEKISSLVEQALDTAYAGDPSLSSLLARLERDLAELGAFDPAFAEMNEALGPLGIVIRELSDLLMRYKEKQDLSPEKMEEVESRLSLIETLKRKYGADIRDIQSYRDGIQREHEDLVGIKEKLEGLAVEIAAAFSAYGAKASALSAARKKAAADLEKLIEREIGLLGMKKARFQIQIDRLPIEASNPERVRDFGTDDVEFVISPNPGEQPKPLRKIASGGELSRIMLALKAAGREKDTAKTLIFDEIDSGIGGKTAEFIAQKLKSLARTHQVICITHLPQIASFADHHFRIEKTVSGNRTFTAVKKLSFEDRVGEIARLMSGSLVTPAALESARDMLRHHAAGAEA